MGFPSAQQHGPYHTQDKYSQVNQAYPGEEPVFCGIIWNFIFLDIKNNREQDKDKQ